MSAAAKRSSSAQPWRAAWTLKISSNHRQLAESRHSLRATNNAATATVTRIESEVFSSASLVEFAGDGVTGLVVIKESWLLPKLAVGKNYKQRLLTKLTRQKSIPCCQSPSANV